MALRDMAAKAEAPRLASAGGVKSSAGHGVRQGVRILNQPMHENRCRGHCCPVQPGLLLLQTGIGAENADNFVNLLLTH